MLCRSNSCFDRHVTLPDLVRLGEDVATDVAKPSITDAYQAIRSQSTSRCINGLLASIPYGETYMESDARGTFVFRFWGPWIQVCAHGRSGRAILAHLVRRGIPTPAAPRT